MATTERVAADDAAWLHMDSAQNLMMVTTLLRFDGALDWSRVTEVFHERVVDRFPRFRQRVVDVPGSLGSIGGPHWADDPAFRLEHHLQRHQVSGDDADSEIQHLVSRQAGVVLTGDRSRWRLHLIDDDQGRSAMLLRSHHSLADGLGLVQLLLALADPRPDGTPHPGQMPLAEHGASSSTSTKRRGRAEAGGASWASAFEESLTTLVSPSKLRAAAAEARDNAQVYRKLGLLADQRNPWRKELSGTKRLVWTTPVRLDGVKLVASATGATLNDLALAMISGAMHEYFAEAGSIPYRIGATIPFNLRPLDEPLAPELGNQIGLVFVNLPVGMDDSHGRLEHIRRRMASIKASPEGQIVRGGMAMVGAIPQRNIARAWMDVFSRKSTTIITNIAGPSTRLELTGVPLESFMLWVPTSGQVAVGLSIVTYDGTLRLGVHVDTAVVPDVDRFVGLLDAELERVDRYVLVR
jgi:diacylglycerol O-acyltransferase / wax synthase